MTYDNTDTNADGAIEAPVDNESVSTDDASVANASSAVTDVVRKTEVDDKPDTADVTSANWGDCEIQKNDTDGAGIIDFKTN